MVALFLSVLSFVGSYCMTFMTVSNQNRALGPYHVTAGSVAVVALHCAVGEILDWDQHCAIQTVP